MKKIMILAIVSFMLVVGLSGCKKEEPTPTVYYSDWVKMDFKTILGQTISEPKITQNIIDSGVILIYIKFINLNTIYTLPYAALNINPNIGVGGISLSANTNVTLNLRYVIIPGQAKISTLGVIPDYNEIKGLYNIPD